MNETNKEVRAIDSPVEVRPESRTIEGYAILFNSPSNPLGYSGDWKEIIEPAALDGVIERSDVLCTVNHWENNGVLARSKKGKGTLTLTIDERGLKYSFEAPNTTLGNDVLEMIKRGDLSSSSFCFSVDVEEWKREGENYTRYIKKVKELYDVSPVYRPAYEDTTVAVRSLDKIKKEGEDSEKELRIYFSQLNKMY
ncbi:HK97 family phage prohead protease [Parabacteroides sp. Marseille-P3160]|uniref:HK97 family phage prohead protease n=1 Tax=Parabacteroides sp. Marseille-P3160 TaxID=1917887 RepID=UPI0009BAF9E0|nr:HK97 family phage prohead protease [Parabacteroides sp. Marseille-P3160]